MLKYYTHLRQIPEDILTSAKWPLLKKQEIFKNIVNKVEIEANAYCNRTCFFCANSHIDRINNRTSLDLKLFEIILKDLKKIEYNQLLRFSRYSEPLANQSILEYICLAKKILPEAKVDIVSNGDYLTAKLLNQLSIAGLDILNISIYHKMNNWVKADAISIINDLAQKYALKLKTSIDTESSIAFNSNFNNMKIFIKSVDIKNVGQDRASSLPVMTKESFKRTSPCYLPFKELMIDYNGSVNLCCNTRSDDVNHKDLISGKIEKEDDIYELYFNNFFSSWREKLIGDNPKPAPCNSCIQQDQINKIIFEKIGRKLIKSLI